MAKPGEFEPVKTNNNIIRLSGGDEQENADITSWQPDSAAPGLELEIVDDGVSAPRHELMGRSDAAPGITIEESDEPEKAQPSLSELQRSARERRARMNYRESGLQAADEERMGRTVLQPAMKIKASSIGDEVRQRIREREAERQPELKISQLDTSGMLYKRSELEEKTANTQPLYSIEELRKRNRQRMWNDTAAEPQHVQPKGEGKVISTPERFDPRKREKQQRAETRRSERQQAEQQRMERKYAQEQRIQEEQQEKVKPVVPDGRRRGTRASAAAVMQEPEPRRRSSDGGEKWLMNRKTTHTLAAVLGALVLVAGLLAAAALVFRLDEVDITGNSAYSDEDIMQLAGLSIGDNLLLVREDIVKERLDAVVDLEVEELGKVYPGGIKITVYEKEEAAVIYSGGTYITIDSRGEVLGYAGDESSFKGLLRIEGVEVSAANAGEQLEVMEEHGQKYDCVLGLLSALDGEDALGLCEVVNVSNLFDIRLDCGGGLYVNLGDSEDLEYKAVVVKTMVPQLKGKSKKGTLYITGRKGANFIADDETPAPVPSAGPEDEAQPEGQDEPEVE